MEEILGKENGPLVSLDLAKNCRFTNWKPIASIKELMDGTGEHLEQEIKATVVHGIARALGISEQRLLELGYG